MLAHTFVQRWGARDSIVQGVRLRLESTPAFRGNAEFRAVLRTAAPWSPGLRTAGSLCSALRPTTGRRFTPGHGQRRELIPDSIPFSSQTQGGWVGGWGPFSERPNESCVTSSRRAPLTANHSLEEASFGKGSFFSGSFLARECIAFDCILQVEGGQASHSVWNTGVGKAVCLPHRRCTGKKMGTLGRRWDTIPGAPSPSENTLPPLRGQDKAA